MSIPGRLNLPCAVALNTRYYVINSSSWISTICRLEEEMDGTEVHFVSLISHTQTKNLSAM